MKFFTDFNIDKNAKICITNLLGNITTKPHSHKGGWAKLLRCQLINEGYNDVTILGREDDLLDFSVCIFDLGAEFSGSLNLFGGLDDKVTNRLLKLYDFSGQMFSWQHDLPDLSGLVSRRDNKSTCEAFKNLHEDFAARVHHRLQDECMTFDHVAKKRKLLIGDSHTPSVWTPEYMIDRRDGRTLLGMVRNNTIIKVSKEIGVLFDEIQIYAGNIDVRHHVFRSETPWKYVQDLASRLALMPTRVTFTKLLPIENESRKLPKTGYYKGEPFTGSWKERSAAVEIFNEVLDSSGKRTYGHWDELKNEQGELSFDCMERPQSVHLSPMFYRWDLDNNVRRY
jgi:hypothetical protein